MGINLLECKAGAVERTIRLPRIRVGKEWKVMEKILIVEDEPCLRKQIKELLCQNGYDAVTASGQSEAMHLFYQDGAIDLFLVDICLMDGDGFSLCESIRRQSVKPVLFLTACDEETSIVKGLNLGGDDYIVKPFRAAELVSRIRANLRRREASCAVKVLKSGDLTLDLEGCMVYEQGEDLHLGAVEYQLLLLLMENAGRIVRRERLLERLWDACGKYAEDNTLSVHMSRLRKKTKAQYIETIRGFGYRFFKPVTECLEWGKI